MELLSLSSSFYETDNRDGDSDSEWYTRELPKILTPPFTLPHPQTPRINVRPPSLNPLLQITPSSTCPLSPAFPPVNDKQQKFHTELPTTAHPNPHPLFVRFLLYEDDLNLRSACSFSSESDDFRFDLDLEMDVHVEGEAEYPMMLPLSLPSSPNVQMETDITNGLEELRSRPSMQPTSSDVVLPLPCPLPMLTSKRSSSIIGSIREEHE